MSAGSGNAPAGLGSLYLRFTAASGLVVVALALLVILPQEDLPSRIAAAFTETGMRGALCYMSVYIIGSVLMQPCFPLTLGAGLLFGFQWGFGIALVASTAGAAAAFLTARYLLRDWLRARMAADARFAAVDRAIAHDGLRVVLLLRLASILPYNLVNYTIGVSGIGLGPFVLATLLGRIPITALHAYLGSISPGIVSLSTATTALSPVEMAIYALGWVATLVAMGYIGRLTRRAFETVTSGRV